MIGTAHGSADWCLIFADTKPAHGRVPAPATATPARTARTTTGTRSHDRAMRVIGSRSAEALLLRPQQATENQKNSCRSEEECAHKPADESKKHSRVRCRDERARQDNPPGSRHPTRKDDHDGED